MPMVGRPCHNRWHDRFLNPNLEGIVGFLIDECFEECAPAMVTRLSLDIRIQTYDVFAFLCETLCVSAPLWLVRSFDQPILREELRRRIRRLLFLGTGVEVEQVEVER